MLSSFADSQDLSEQLSSHFISFNAEKLIHLEGVKTQTTFMFSSVKKTSTS